MSAAPATVKAVRASESEEHEQRAHRRYPVALEAEYKLRHKGKVQRSGIGRTLNVSSGGVFLESSDSLPEKGRIELMMTWPFLLEGVCPLRLVMHGRIVRCEENGVAIRSDRHEFRTAGARGSKRSELGGSSQ